MDIYRTSDFTIIFVSYRRSKIRKIRKEISTGHRTWIEDWDRKSSVNIESVIIATLYFINHNLQSTMAGGK